MKGYFRYTACLLCLILAAAAFSGCTNRMETPPENDELHIYASFYPIYALAEGLLSGIEDTYLHCLIQPQDGCLRDYQVSDWDLSLLENSADMVIIGGRGLESFENTLYSLGETGPAVAAVLYNKELAPGIGNTSKEGAENHWQDANPHLYMDPEGAALMAESIAAQMVTADPGNSGIYMANLENTINRLRSVSLGYEAVSEKIGLEKVILMNEASVYIALGLDLEVETCVFRDSGEAYYDYELEKVLNELKKCEARVILIEKQAPERFCEVLEGAGFTLAKIDTMSAKSANEGFEGYLGALEFNAKAVEAAFEATK